MQRSYRRAHTLHLLHLRTRMYLLCIAQCKHLLACTLNVWCTDISAGATHFSRFSKCYISPGLFSGKDDLVTYCCISTKHSNILLYVCIQLDDLSRPAVCTVGVG